MGKSLKSVVIKSLFTRLNRRVTYYRNLKSVTLQYNLKETFQQKHVVTFSHIFWPKENHNHKSKAHLGFVRNLLQEKLMIKSELYNMMYCMQNYKETFFVKFNQITMSR